MNAAVDAPSSEGAPPVGSTGHRQSLSELAAEILAIRAMPLPQAEQAAITLAMRVLNAEGVGRDLWRIVGSHT